MEAKELRIGNIIECALNEELRIPDKIPRIVSAILPFGEVLLDLNPQNETTTKCSLKHCYGIPLTEELIIKLGGIQDKTIHIGRGYNLHGMLLIFFDGVFTEYVHQIKLTGLHHLQNLYYFTRGKELEIQLP